jgi:DNA-binding GntR family transcriptional regulator
MTAHASRDAATAQYETLRAMIIDGELRPGALLLETELTSRLGVSRTPIREALARLAQGGLIVRDVRGYRVRRRTPEEILEIYDVRIILESACAARAAHHATEYDLARLVHLTEQGASCSDHGEQVAVNADWHAALRHAAHHATMTHLLDELGTLQQIYNPQMQVADARTMRAGQHDHERILAQSNRAPQTPQARR